MDAQRQAYRWSSDCFLATEPEDNEMLIYLDTTSDKASANMKHVSKLSKTNRF